MTKKTKIIFFSVAIFLTICVYLILAVSYFIYPLKYKKEIENSSTRFGVSNYLIASVINAESGFDKNAVSRAGAKGLMQVMPSTASWLCQKLNVEFDENKLFETAYNIDLGSYYLCYLQQKFETQTEVLCAYNAGEGVVLNWLANKELSSDGETLDNIPYKETENYVKKVKQNLHIYKFKLS